MPHFFRSLPLVLHSNLFKSTDPPPPDYSNSVDYAANAASGRLSPSRISYAHGRDGRSFPFDLHRDEAPDRERTNPPNLAAVFGAHHWRRHIARC